jgi:transposase
VLTRGNRNECPVFEELLQSVAVRPGEPPAKLAADKGYSSDKIRGLLVEAKVEPVIPLRKNEHVKDPPGFDEAAYRRRNAIERCVGRLKECRRIATRFEKLAVNFMAMVSLAMIVQYLRLDL